MTRLILSKSASDRFSIGFNTLMCLTKDRFQRKRSMNVLMRSVRRSRMSSVTASDLFFVLMISLSILNL